MTEAWTQVMGLDPYELQLSLPAGEAVSRWLKHKHPQHTAKLVSRDTGMDPRTVENVLGAHLSAKTFTILCRTYGWPFLSAVGAAVVGETYENSITRELEDIANARRELEAHEASLRGAYARVRARRSVDHRGLRLVHPEDPGSGGEDRRLG